MELKYKILDFKQGKTKKGEAYYRVSLYANWSTNILDCFVTQDVFDLIKNNTITDENIGEYVTFKFINGKVYLSINIK